MLNKKFLNWFNSQRKKHKINIKIKGLNKLKKWRFNNEVIFHETKKFFKIIAIDVKSNFGGKNWDQPIIVQNEQGILGIIKNKVNNKYLLQAKVEPGNKNKLQLSPTVQATKSNYNRVHGGKKIPFLRIFLKNKKNFISQSEQGYRYLYKFNNNIIVETNNKIKIYKNFYWFSKEEILKLIKKRCVLNMDTISVFSSFISKSNNDNPLNSNFKIKNWLKNKDRTHKLKVKIKPLSQLKDWQVQKNKIVHKNNKHFSVIGLSIKTNEREIKEWDQPVIQGKRLAFVGYIIKKFNNTNHYLCRYNKKPGLKFSTLSSTINTSDINNYKKNNLLSIFQKNILKNIFFKRNKRIKKVFDNILSDEGGRFYNCDIKYKAIELENNFNFKIPKNYIWISQNQMIDLIGKKKIDIEARLIFGCVNINNIK